jgi:hypothetical protein
LRARFNCRVRFASYGCAAPTYGRAKFAVMAGHNRPKVGATRARLSHWSGESELQ